MVASASWREPSSSGKHFKAHAATTVAEHVLGAPAQQRTVFRPAALPIYRAELTGRPSVPATVVVVTERGYVSADGSQVWTMSVYRFAVLTPGRALIQDGHTPKRI